MILPWDEAAERQLVGCCLLDADIWMEALEEVEPEHFYGPFHKRLWSWSRGKVRDSLPLDAGSVPREVCVSDEDRAALSAALDCVAGVTNWRAYASAVRDSWVLRSLVLAGEGMRDLAQRTPADARSALEWAQRSVFALSLDRGTDKGKSWSDLAHAAVERMYREEPEPEGILSGIRDLDQVTGGLRPGQLVIVGGRTGNGKTVLGAQYATHAAFHQRRHALYISLEMSGESVSHRILSGLSGVSLRKFEYPQYATEMERARIETAANEFYSAPLEVYDHAREVTLGKITSMVRRRKAQGGLDLLVVDYLGLMERSDVARKGVNTAYEFAEVTRGLKILAGEAGLPILLIVQVNRAVDHREDPIPRLADLSDSGSIEKDADLVMFTVFHEKHSKAPADQGRASLVVAKNRGGRTLTLPARWAPHLWRIVGEEVDPGAPGSQNARGASQDAGDLLRGT